MANAQISTSQLILPDCQFPGHNGEAQVFMTFNFWEHMAEGHFPGPSDEAVQILVEKLQTVEPLGPH